MKKAVPIVVVLALLLMAGLFYYYSGTKNKNFSAKVAENTVETNKPNTGGNIIQNIQDALTKSASFKCQYPDPTGKAKITTYVKNGAIRVDNMAVNQGEKGGAIIKDNKMWIWTEGKKEGMVLTMDKTNPQVNQQDQKAEVIKEMEKYKQYCQVQMISDSMFVPPKDVDFKDLDQLMKGVGQEMFKDLPKGSLPEETVGGE